MESIDGKQIARDIIENLKKREKPDKIFAAILVDSASSPRVGSTNSGNISPSESFLKIKEKTAKELGIDFRIYKFSENINSDDLKNEVKKIVDLKEVGGVIIQLPLSSHLNSQQALNVIPKEKDVDVLGESALGAFYNGTNPILPPAVAALDEILLKVNYQLLKVKVVVVGLGSLIGKPISVWLMRRCGDLYLLRRGSDFSILKQADLVITGTGQAGLIKPEMLKENAGIIDFGYSFKDGKITGDFDSKRLAMSDSRLAYFTPTPGGTGPILVAKLFENFYILNNL